MDDPRSVYGSHATRATASKGRTPWLVRPWLVRVPLIAVTLVAANRLAGEEPTVIAALALGGSVALFGASWTHAVLAVRRDAAWRGRGPGQGETEAAARARALEPFIGSLVNLAAAIVGAAIVLGLYSR